MYYISQNNFFRDELDDREVVVSIQCITYNHEKYIREALEGFVTQKTNFRFEAIVHDDCSTDNTAAIIREYAEKYPSIIKPIFETENQYAKRDGSVTRIVNNHTRGKYVAFCEGDDYWTDPLKLQKQVDFLESHPEYSMCVTNFDILENDGTIHPSFWNSTTDCDLPIKDVIMNGGLFIATCSVVLRADLYNQRPKAMYKLHVGDYPMQIYMASVGKVRQLKDLTCVYRYMSTGSWTQKNRESYKSIEKIRDYTEKERKLLETMDEVTGYKYHKYFRERLIFFCFPKYGIINKSKAVETFFLNPISTLRHFKLATVLYYCLPNSIIKQIRKAKKIINA